MKRLPKEVELQRLDAYTKTSDDDAAAQLLNPRVTKKLDSQNGGKCENNPGGKT